MSSLLISTVPAHSVELHPQRLAVACAQSLAVAGAGLSLFNERLSVPLGASDEIAAFAERQQVSRAEGPCWQAHAQGRPVRASAADMRQRWPHFARHIGEHTPYRSVVSLPLLHLGGGWSGALDLYLDHPTRAYVLPLAGARVLAGSVAAELSIAEERSSARTLPHARPESAVAGVRDGVRELTGEEGATEGRPSDALPPERRMALWVAVATIATELDTTAENAAKLLRGYAPDEPPADVADLVLGGIVSVSDLQRS